MCKEIRLNAGMLRLGLAAVLSAALVTLSPLQAHASGNNGSNGASNNNTITGETLPGDPQVWPDFGDAWEVTLYIDKIGGEVYEKEHRCVGSYMLYGKKPELQ